MKRILGVQIYSSYTYPKPYGGFPKLGLPFGGPHNKDYRILESVLGSPYLGKLPYTYPKPGSQRDTP